MTRTHTETPMRRPDNFRVMRVVSATSLAPRMRRLVLEPERKNDDLTRFAVDHHMHMRLLFPEAWETTPPWPSLGEDGRIVWPGGKPMTERKYTLRRVDPQGGTVTVDMAIHPEADGPGSTFAQTARPGALVGMAGPGGGSIGDGDWYLLAGDETALPAIARILETLPSSARGRVLIEVEGSADELPLAHPMGIGLDWLHRTGFPAGEASPLAGAIAALAWPEAGRPYAWVAGELRMIRMVRRHLREVVGLPRERHLAVAYWRRGQAENPPEDQGP